MNKFITALSLTMIVAGCNTAKNKNIDMEDKTIQSANNETPASDTTPKVTGIGGIFFFSENPGATIK